MPIVIKELPIRVRVDPSEDFSDAFRFSSHAGGTSEEYDDPALLPDETDTGHVPDVGDSLGGTWTEHIQSAGDEIIIDGYIILL